jgi:outer membrane protein assembly factor BamB/putative cell wall-binding protein
MALLFVLGNAAPTASVAAIAAGDGAAAIVPAATLGDAAVTYTYLRGSDRYDTAIRVSKAMFPAALPAGSGLVLAPGETFQAALCGAPLAAAYGGPLLLTPGSGLNTAVRAELLRLAPTHVFCVGLPPAVADAVVTALGPGATVTSINGDAGSVYDLSYRVAKALEAKVGDMTAATAIITRGDMFPDALGVSPLACAKSWPILLTSSGSGAAVHTKVVQALTELGITKALKVGTYAALPAQITGVANLSGADRYHTNANIATWAKANAGLTLAHTGIATGDKFPDALAAGPYLAKDGGLLLLSPVYGPFPAPAGAVIAGNLSEVTHVSFLAMIEPVAMQVKAVLEGVAGDWPTYHHDAARSGLSSDQGLLGEVKQAWATAELDGTYIYAQPLVVGDQVLVATEGNTVVSLDAATGAVDWSTNLGAPVPRSLLPGGNIDPSGITGTPVVDVPTGTLYAVAFLRNPTLHHELFAIQLATGTVLWHRAIDPPGLSALVEQQRPALALSGGRVYVAYGGLSGDLGAYKGAVVSAAADGTGDLAGYVVPTSRMGGIWNPTGPSVDADGDIWVITGNSASRTAYDYGNAVLRLSPGLSVLDYFAPTNWAYLNAADLDLNSLGQILLAGERILAVGKNGVAYLLDGNNLGHIGAALATRSIGSAPFGTAAVMASRVFVPCIGGLIALDISPNAVQVAWKLTGGTGSPIIAAGHVWTLTYGGLLRAVNPSTGGVVYSLQLSKPASRFITLSAAGGRLFVADGRRLVALTMR